MTPRELEEYRSLRATIQHRGTARHWVLVAGLGLWAAATLVVATLLTVPVIALVPLLILATTFEAVLALHVGVERVGRYIQVFFEHAEDGAAWEETAMAYGRGVRSGLMDALFTPLFVVATFLNLILVPGSQPTAIEWAVVSAAHAFFLGRVWAARRQAGRQRGEDLERFQRLKAERLQASATSDR